MLYSAAAKAPTGKDFEMWYMSQKRKALDQLDRQLESIRAARAELDLKN